MPAQVGIWHRPGMKDLWKNRLVITGEAWDLSSDFPWKQLLHPAPFYASFMNESAWMSSRGIWVLSSGGHQFHIFVLF
jgi:hypothetical protein